MFTTMFLFTRLSQVGKLYIAIISWYRICYIQHKRASKDSKSFQLPLEHTKIDI